MGDGRIFLKIFRASLLNDDLSNEPNLGRIHLAGQYHERMGGVTFGEGAERT